MLLYIIMFDDVLFCRMAINVSVQYNGGLLPDIVLLTRCNYHRGTRLNAMKRFCICSLRSHLNVLTFFPPDWGMLRRSRCVLIFFKYWCGVCRDDLGACRPLDNYSLKEQTEQNQNRSFLWSLGAIQLRERPDDQIPKDPLGFGLRDDQKTKIEPELALSQTP